MADPTKALETAIYQALREDATLGLLLPSPEHLVTVTATGGTFTLTYGGKTTAALAYNATATQIRSALEMLSSVGTGKVTVSGSNPWTVTFVAGMIGALSGDGSNLEGDHPELSIAQRAAVYNTIAPPEATYPFAVFHKVAATQHNDLGSRAYWEYLYQVRAISEGISKAVILQALAEIDVLLERSTLSLTSGTVLGSLRESDIPDLPAIEGGTIYQQVGGQWRMWVREA